MNEDREEFLLKAIKDEEEKTVAMTEERFKLLLQIESKLLESRKLNEKLDEKFRKQQEEAKQAASSTEVTFYVGNLPRQTTEMDLELYFSSFGEISRISLFRRRGPFAFITFAKLLDMKKFPMQSHELKGRHLFVELELPRQWKESQRAPSQAQNIGDRGRTKGYVGLTSRTGTVRAIGNYSKDHTSEFITEYFSKMGHNIISVRSSKHPNRCRFFEFETIESAEDVLSECYLRRQ